MNNEKSSSRRVVLHKLLIGIILILFDMVGMSFMGCGSHGVKKPTEKTAGVMVQKELYRKYGIKTEVDGVQWADGAYGLAQASYEVELHIKGDNSKKFTAAVTVSGDQYTDDYGMLIYQPGFEEMVREQIDELTDYSATYEFHCLRIGEKYTKASEWKEFADVSSLSVDVRFHVPCGITHEDIAKEMTPFLEKLRKTGFCTTIEVYQEGKRILRVTALPRSDGIDYDEMLRWFR